jgi:predicted nucleic acid-binding protein
MILIDTSVWADHFRRSDDMVTALLGAGRVLLHPFVVGELAMGNLSDWSVTVASLRALPTLEIANDDLFFAFVAENRLMGKGVGFVDAHLLASVSSRPGTKLWCRDKRLNECADRLGLAHTS